MQSFGTFSCDISRYERDKTDNRSFLNVDSTLDVTEHFKSIVESITRNKDNGYIAFITSNHDSVRPSYYLDDKALRLFYFITFTLPGIPFLYYGDEIAMKHQYGIPSKECGFSRTAARTVMNWDHSKNNGFSVADEDKLFLPIDRTTNVEMMQKDPSSVYYLVKKLIALRRAQSGLQGNNIEIIDCADKRLLIYKRNDFVVAVNPSAEQKTVKGNYGKTIFFDGGAKIVRGDLVLAPRSAAIVL